MGVFDKVKKILFDEEELEDLPVHKDSKDEEVEEMKKGGGVILHHEDDVEEDTIQEVKVPEETPVALRFPVDVDENTTEFELTDIQSRLNEDNFSRTEENEKVQEEQLTRSKEDIIKEYNETLRLQREAQELRRRVEVPQEEKHETVKEVESFVREDKEPYRVPPVISPVFGVLDKNYDPDNYEETRQKISLTNAGNKSLLGERQFGPVSYNDQGLPQPKYVKGNQTVTTTSEAFKEELKKDKELLKEAEEIEKEIVENIINDEPKEEIKLEDTNDYDEIIEEVAPEIESNSKDVIEDLVENDEVITGSPYDDILDDTTEVEKPTVDIEDLINSAEEADITPKTPKNIEENENLDDTIETDLYGLIDSMYKDED